MNYPLLSEYRESIRGAGADYFRELTDLHPVMTNGAPVMSSGNFAAVFKMNDGQKDYAVKCFTREQEGRDEAYRQIAKELEFAQSSYLVKFRYLPDELYVSSKQTDNTDFPVVVMDWVEGDNLEVYVKNHIRDGYAMGMLAYRFCRMASWLLGQPFAHGDLKPDNIMVRGDGSLVLVDYDGMFVPAMRGAKSREQGSQDYRHPLRKDFDERTDDFALAVLAVSLKALALKPSLYRQDGTGLLFSASDYNDLSHSAVVVNIEPLLQDSEFERLYALFLLAHSQMVLPHDAMRLFDIKRPVGQPNSGESSAPSTQSAVETFNVGGVEFRMVRVEGGSFTMGADDADYDEKPAHRVTLSTYYVGETQVTQALWQAVMGSNPSRNRSSRENPVECVSWDDCHEFAGKLGEMTGRTFRLPTEAEWEYAARGGSRSRGYKYAGSDDIDAVAWYYGNSGDATHPVAQKRPNELGLYDMSGNVWEWCEDRYGGYGGSAQVNPKGPDGGAGRVLRGGSRWFGAGGCRVSYRVSSRPWSGFDRYGLRLVLVP